MASTQVVGILGGMGPAAGADFVRLFVTACAARMQELRLPVSDQGFPEHWLAQVPVPDRSQALGSPGPGGHQPLEPMLQAMGRLAALGARSVAIACNTAHAWHGAMQERFPQLEVLHVAREVAHSLARAGVDEVGLLATTGTYRSGVYGEALAAAGVHCRIPDAAGQAMLMRGIYEGVKAGDIALARECFSEAARRLAEAHGLSALILGCTEIPLALKEVGGHEDLCLVDPAQVLAEALARRAYGGVGEMPTRWMGLAR
ncbi:MAG: amino acid racemase [Burkholderiaceae bacterium]